jgi:hypothetical protein
LILALVGSLRIYKLSTPDALLADVLDILDLCSSFLAVLLDLNPWHFTTLRRFCNPSSSGWKLSSHLDTHNVFDKVRIACPLPMGQSIFVFLRHVFLLSEIPSFRSLPRPFFRILLLHDLGWVNHEHDFIYSPKMHSSQITHIFNKEVSLRSLQIKIFMP